MSKNRDDKRQVYDEAFRREAERILATSDRPVLEVVVIRRATAKPLRIITVDWQLASCFACLRPSVEFFIARQSQSVTNLFWTVLATLN